jgi:hypothetical protein
MRRKGLELEKEKEKLLPLPRLGRIPAQPPRARTSPLSLPGPGGPTCARLPPADTQAPPVSASPPPSRADSFRWQPGPTRQFHPPRPSLTGTSAAKRPPHLVASPLMLASLRDNPATVLEPTLTPQPARAIASALAPFPPSWRARRCSPSPPCPSLPRAPIKGPARAPSLPHSSGHPHCPPPRAVQASAAVLPSPLR